MKVLIDPRPAAPLPQPLPADLTLIRQPSHRTGLAISVFVGMLIPFIPCLLLSLHSTVALRASVSQDETVPLWIVFPVFVVCVIVHEFLHLICHPDGGRSNQSLVLFWPRRFQFGVYYAGFMQRSRWLVMRLAPLVGLTLLPTLLLRFAYPAELSFFWQQFVVLIIVVNGLGAGSDVVASAIVARQVPAQGEIGIWNGRACWRLVPADQGKLL
jgi:uncharacterized protein YqgC (DUF456 family)